MSAAVLMDPQRAAEEVFRQANRSKTGKLTPGELLLQLEICCRTPADAAEAFPGLFLSLDADGDDLIELKDMKNGYLFARNAGLRLKTGDGEVEQQSDAQMEEFEAKAKAMITPKVEALEQCFKLLDLGGGGKITARKLSAFQIVMADALRREQEEAAAAAAAADPKAAKEQPPPTPAPKIDPKAHGYLMTDLVTAFEQIKASGLATLDDNGELGVDFKGFRAMLARHAGALEGIDAGGKKGKKGKKKK